MIPNPAAIARNWTRMNSEYIPPTSPGSENFTSSPGSSFTIEPGSRPASGAPEASFCSSPGLLPITGSSGLFSMMKAANIAASFFRTSSASSYWSSSWSFTSTCVSQGWPRCWPGRSGL